MTFREHAAIAMYMSGSGPGPSPGECIEAAQRLADSACKAWGHDRDHERDIHCKRCGTTTKNTP